MSMFTRRHYVWLASAMRDAQYSIATVKTSDPDLRKLMDETVRVVISDFADSLADENPDGFDRQRFIDAIYNISTNANTN